jgi:hypothetical protein
VTAFPSITNGSALSISSAVGMVYSRVSSLVYPAKVTCCGLRMLEAQVSAVAESMNSTAKVVLTKSERGADCPCYIDPGITAATVKLRKVISSISSVK